MLVNVVNNCIITDRQITWQHKTISCDLDQVIGKLCILDKLCENNACVQSV